jgi:hypothetical protein
MAREVSTATERDGRVIAEFRPKTSIEELQGLVEIDWNADPEGLLKTPRKEGVPPFLRNLSSQRQINALPGREPNQMILEYPESRAAKSREPAQTVDVLASPH